MIYSRTCDTLLLYCCLSICLSANVYIIVFVCTLYLQSFTYLVGCPAACLSFPPSAYATLTFAPATAPCAVIPPTGEQLSTSSTLNNLSSSDDGGNRWAGLFEWHDLSFPLLVLPVSHVQVLVLAVDAGRAHRAHHGLLSVVPISPQSIPSVPLPPPPTK